MKKVISLLALVLVLVCSVNFCFADTAAVTTAETTPETTAETQTETKEKEETTASPMKDIDGSSDLGKSIAKLIAGGVVNGYLEADGTYTYRPLNPITRAEFCKMINTTFDYTIMADNKFTDVTPADWYYIHVLPAIHYGYIQGYQDGTFRGNDFITREEVCTILSRILDQTSDKEVVITDTVSEWAKPYVTNIIALGYMPLEEGGKFRSTEDMTRGELAVTLDDFVVVKEPEKTPAVNAGGTTGTGTGENTNSGGNTTVKPSTGGGGGTGGGSGNSDDNNQGSDDGNQGSGDSGNQGTSDTPAEATYKITYNLNNGTLSGQKTTYKASDADYTLLTPTKNGGYKFFGWYETAEFDGEPVTVLASGSTGDKTYYAKWGYLYTIEYVLTPSTYGEEITEDKKGKLDGTEKKKYTEFDEDYELPTPYRDDGTPFMGWYIVNEDEKFNGAPAISVSDEYLVTTIPSGSTGKKTFYAVWEDMVVDSGIIYSQLDDIDWDLDANIEDINSMIKNSEVFTTESAANAAFIIDTMYNAIDVVFNEWQADNVLVNNSLVREVYKKEADDMRAAIDTFTQEDRVEFETILALRLSKETLDNLVDMFNINVNYGQ